jgi:PIG-X / PBN1
MVRLHLLVPCRLLLLAVSCLYNARSAAATATDESVAAVPVVITLRKYSVSNGPLILHGLCYPDGHNQSSPPQLQVADCCQLLLQGIDSWSSNMSAEGTERNNLENVVLQSCLREIVPIPQVPQQEPHIESLSNGTVSRLPTFSFWYSSRMMESSSSSLIAPQPSLQNATQSAAQPIHVDDSRCNLWHGSTVAAPDDNARSKRFVRLLNPAANLEQSSSWTASIKSNLSASGGLHRDLESYITLTPPKKSNVNGSFETTGIMQVSLYVLIHLPSDLFVNVEDLFRYSTSSNAASSWNVTLVPPIAVIDQEEPSFVSPAHALLVHVSARLDNDGSLGWQPEYNVSFVTKLHVRYPKPFAVVDNTSSNFRRVMLPRPELLTGAIVRRHSTGTDTCTIHVHVCPPTMFSSPLELWIAAGHQSEYAVVWWVTLLAAIAGALVMLKDIAAASIWE